MVGSRVFGVFRGRFRAVMTAVVRRVLRRNVDPNGRGAGARFPPVEAMQVTDVAFDAGHVFDEELLALEAASDTHRPHAEWGPEYEVVKAAFDPLFYLSRNPDIARQALDPVGHYLRAGARENRDPAPWFSTAEYRRAYLKGAAGQQPNKVNPFYHFLTEGRAAGYAPRAPANYDAFCRSIGSDAHETSERVRARMEDVRDRLRRGELGEMVMKATALDPLIGRSWRAGLRVRVPPASNAIGVRRIGHLIDLQHQAGGRRAKAVIVVDGRKLGAGAPEIEAIIERTIANVTADETVVVVVDGLGSVAHLNPMVRVVHFGLAMPRAKDYKPGRTLVEFIRSMRPEIVVNLNAVLMNKAMRRQGRAVAASSVVYQYLPFDVTRDAAQLGSRYYRAIDVHHRVIVPTQAERDHLTRAFTLPEAQSETIWIACDEHAPPPFIGLRTEQVNNAPN